MGRNLLELESERLMKIGRKEGLEEGREEQRIKYEAIIALKDQIIAHKDVIIADKDYAIEQFKAMCKKSAEERIDKETTDDPQYERANKENTDDPKDERAADEMINAQNKVIIAQKQKNIEDLLYLLAVKGDKSRHTVKE